MDISNLPAVKAATAPNGVFSQAARKPFIHPNFDRAKSVLRDGVVPIDEVPFLMQARALAPYEYRNTQTAYDQVTGREVRNFERIFVVSTAGDYILSFGPYLVIDEDTLSSPYYPQVLAHELAHLNNGDSYVKAALWFLGKGWMQEFMSPFGIIHPQDEGKIWAEGAEGVTLATLRYGWLGFFASTGLILFKNIGSGVRGLEVEIQQYFHQWDIEADSLAEKWVGIEVYHAYLHNLERIVGKRPFDASFQLRRAEAEERQNPQRKLPSPKENLPKNSNNLGGVVLKGCGTVIAGGILMFITILVMVRIFVHSTIESSVQVETPTATSRPATLPKLDIITPVPLEDESLYKSSLVLVDMGGTSYGLSIKQQQWASLFDWYVFIHDGNNIEQQKVTSVFSGDEYTYYVFTHPNGREMVLAEPKEGEDLQLFEVKK